MIKMFCDVCGKEIERNFVIERLRIRLKDVELEIIAGVDGVWNGGQLCKDCLMKAIAEGKECGKWDVQK